MTSHYLNRCWQRYLTALCITPPQWFNSSPPSTAYMRRQTGSALVQTMTCRLDGAKPLSEPMLTNCQLDPKEYVSMKFYLKYQIFSFKKMSLNMSSTNWQPFCAGGDELSTDPWMKQVTMIKSPRSGVTLCFQSVSAVSASAAAKTFPSHVKTVWAKLLIFGTKNTWVWGNVLDDLSMTLGQSHGCGIH